MKCDCPKKFRQPQYDGGGHGAVQDAFEILPKFFDHARVADADGTLKLGQYAASHDDLVLVGERLPTIRGGDAVQVIGHIVQGLVPAAGRIGPTPEVDVPVT